jgi:hypothetical protein
VSPPLRWGSPPIFLPFPTAYAVGSVIAPPFWALNFLVLYGVEGLLHPFSAANLLNKIF